jgi:predicted amidohydrolase YtcJ
MMSCATSETRSTHPLAHHQDAHGLVDSHIHLLGLASRAIDADCIAARSVEELQALILQRASDLAPGTWIHIGTYDEFRLRERRHPTREELDRVSDRHPVRLRHRSGHASVLNSLGLQIADADSHTGGLVIDGENQLRHFMPRLDPTALESAVARVSSELWRLGIGEIHDATPHNGPSTWTLFERLINAGAIRQRVTMMYGTDSLDYWADHPRIAAGGRLRLGPMKLMLSIATGEVLPSAAELIGLFHAALHVGTGVALHVADEAMLAVALFASGEARARGWDLPIRFEHVPICPPALAAEIARLHVTVVTQPSFLLSSGDRYLHDIDAHLQPWLYPIRSLLHAGVNVRAGSDAPIGPVDPRQGMLAAVTRMTETGARIVAAESISPTEARRMYSPFRSAEADER